MTAFSGYIEHDANEATRNLWACVSSVMPEPTAAGCYEIVPCIEWDAGRHHVSIEYEDGMYVWLYRDRILDSVAGGEVESAVDLAAAISVYAGLLAP